MRILYILPFIPWPIKVRSSNLIPRLAQRHEIDLVCLSDGKDGGGADVRWLSGFCKSLRIIPHSQVRGICQSLLALPTTVPLRMAYCRNPQMSQAVADSIRQSKPDVIYIERWRALQYVPQTCDIPVLCDPTDSMTLYNRRLVKVGSISEKLIGLEEYVKFLRYEGVLARRANVSVFCSRIDLETVRRAAPDAEYAIVPNGVDCDQFALKEESDEEPNTIVFTGNFAYRPNQLAVDFFLGKIFPTIRLNISNAKFLVVGKGANAFFSKLGAPDGVEIHDFVPQLRDYVARATVAVAPITVGTGVSNKLLEAFSTGTPVISTTMASGDLPVVDGIHLLMANDPKTFAEKVTRLLSDATLRRNLRQNARRLVEEKYAWNIVTGQLESLLTSLHQRKPTSKQDSTIFHVSLTSATS